VTGYLLAAVVVLVLCSAFLSAAEGAVFSLGESRLRTLQQEGFSGADDLTELRSRAGPLHDAVFLLNGLTNLGAIGIFASDATAAWGALSGIGATLVAVPVLFLFGEILPRSLVSRRPVRMALTAAPILIRFERWVRPLSRNILRLEGVLSGRNGENGTSGAREVREISEIGKEEGIIEEEEHLLVERAFRLDELTAWDAMTPRVDIFAWEDSLKLSDIVKELENVPFSRVPIYRETVDDVTGILYIREAYESYVAGNESVPLSAISREPFFVPGSLSLAKLLRDFQARRIHMGIVADEFGGTDGLVTLEDVLEELVGEIVDETDVDEEPLTRISRSELVAEGSVDLREINYAFNVTLPQLEHRSLNGYILEELGRVPENGEVFEEEGVRFEILEATETQVVRARLTKLPTSDDEAA